MEKYLLLLSATHILSTSCMEMERYREDNSAYVPVYLVSNPMYTAEHYQPMYCEANQPGWQQLHDIMYVTYKNEQTTSHSKNIDATKKSPLLTINTTQNTGNTVEKIYHDAHSLMLYKPSTVEWYQYKNLTSIIQTMRSAGVSEDQMAAFCYAKQKEFSKENTYTKKRHHRTTLLFNYIKQYRLAAETTQESLAQCFSTKNHDLSPLQSQHPIHPDQSITNLSLLKKHYPEFTKLVRNVFHLRRFRGHCNTPCEMIYWLYDQEASKQIREKYDVPAHFNTLTVEEFYSNIYEELKKSDLSECIEDHGRTYELLVMTKKMKKICSLDTETALGHRILNTQDSGILSQLFKLNNKQREKNFAAIWCQLVKKYNITRGKKRTPKPTQVYVYHSIQLWKLALPDTFNVRLLDDNLYAFDEFAQLTADTRKLMDASVEEVQQWVENLYSLRSS